VRANAGCKWSEATVPGLDTSVPFDVALDTTAFPLAALSPALGSVVQRLKGTLDMHVRAQGHPDPAAQDLNVQGKVQIHGGNMMPLAGCALFVQSKRKRFTAGPVDFESRSGGPDPGLIGGIDPKGSAPGRSAYQLA
jgi:hypothetical protein